MSWRDFKFPLLQDEEDKADKVIKQESTLSSSSALSALSISKEDFDKVVDEAGNQELNLNQYNPLVERLWATVELLKRDNRTKEEQNLFWQIYMPILESLYSGNPGGWLKDGQPVTPRERVQIEKFLRGWYVK